MSSYYHWYGLHTDDGNDVCVVLVGGRYFANVHDLKYPKATSPFWHFASEKAALRAGRHKLRRYLKRGGPVAPGWEPGSVRGVMT